MVGSGDYCDGAINLDAEALGHQDVVVIGRVFGKRHVLTFGLKGSVGLSDHEIVSQDKFESRRIVLQFGLVPCIFKGEDLSLVTVLGSLPKPARNDACADCN